MSARSKLGRFVVLEGLDGAGTTTQAQILAERIQRSGHAVFLTREPSDGPIGMLLRQALSGRLGLPSQGGPLSPQTLALLFAADRMDHLQAQVLPALERGQHVVCDRYVLSSLAYQGSQLPMNWVAELNRMARAPDLTLFLDVDLKVAANRRALRGGSEELFDGVQQRIARGYRKAILRMKKTQRIAVIRGNGSVESVQEACWKVVSEAL